MSDLRRSLDTQPIHRPEARRLARPVLWGAGGLAILLIVIAWIDGGERSLRPFVEEVALPAAATIGGES
jgi:hypothetical protein